MEDGTYYDDCEEPLNEYNLFKCVFKSGEGGEQMDCRLDEAAWEELVKSNPKLAQYKDPANAFPYYEQMNGMFNGKFATGEDAIDIDGLFSEPAVPALPTTSLSTPSSTTSTQGTASNDGMSTPIKKAYSRHHKRDPSSIPKYAKGASKKRRGNAGALNDITDALTMLVESKTGGGSLVAKAMDILEAMGIDDDSYVEAIEYLGEEKAARTFVAMSEKKRKLVLTKKFNATFTPVNPEEETDEEPFSEDE